MSGDIGIEALGDHEYLVSFPTAGEAVLSRFQVTEATLAHLSRGRADERRIVVETAVYLSERQQTADLPPMIDLDDVAAAYGDDYLAELGRRLDSP
ncbi:hypothetical protein ACFV1W_35465 [Kitasatospora sp. NPDC059648]|uniref:hypothetical protein n=1 Tax=Kitasatospora sp. NPDC059648 TaxID=3346894 RepID=UPI0036D0038D